MRKTTIYMVIFFTIFIFTGCAKKQNQAQSTNLGNRQNFERRRPDFGQPEEPADIRGLVSSLTGNEVTVLKIERPQLGQEGDSRENKDENENKPKTSLGTGNAPRMPGMGRGMRGNRQNMDDDAKAQMLERIKEMASGEEKILIPVGIQMLKPDTSSETKQPSMIEATLEDVDKDAMVQIWLDDSITDRKVAKFVLIMR